MPETASSPRRFILILASGGLAGTFSWRAIEPLVSLRGWARAR